MTAGHNANSTDAYRSLDMTERKKRVYDLLLAGGQPLTDKVVKSQLGISPTTGIITEMIMDGTLEKVDDIVCPLTKSTTRRVFVASNPPRHEIIAELSTDAHGTFDKISAILSEAIKILKEHHPGSRFRGVIKVKFGSRITDIEVDGSDGPLTEATEDHE